MRPVDPAVFVADLGLEGCRHAKPKSRRQVLLMEEETLAALGLERLFPWTRASISVTRWSCGSPGRAIPVG
jgi:hypothetical protein